MFNGLVVGAVFAIALSVAPGLDKRASHVDPLERASNHPLASDRPCPDFFDGALLGNGGLGAVVTTRPDAIVIHFGHNNVWDIRIAEDNKDKIGTFREVFEKVAAIPADSPSLESDPWYMDYSKMTHANYEKPYPRPYPCGSLLLGFDRRKVELLGHRLDIATGSCIVRLLVDRTPAQLQIVVEMDKDRLWLQLTDTNGNPIANCLDRVRLIPDPDAPATIPPYQVLNVMQPNVLSFRQVLPRNEPAGNQPGEPDPRDRAFRLSVRVSGNTEPRKRLNWEGLAVQMGPLERGFASNEPFVAVVQLDEGLASGVEAGAVELSQPVPEIFAKALTETQESWEVYWARSGVALGDKFLERVWYWNHYFFNCATKSGVNCPGLFANWSYRNIGTAWHGDYHMNYNTQQPFWLPFSSNRIEKNLPYLEATRVLGIKESEAGLIADVQDILNHFPEYPTADSRYGTVFVSVPGEHAEVVYNTPNSLMTVFPGEDHGLHSPAVIGEMLRNTYRNTQNEGGNDLVFMNLQAARIGQLDLDRFKRQIEYCLLANGTCTNMVLQVHGRYNDTTRFDFMRPMGIWFENFGLPVVINECLMQSYNGTIRLFPNWPKDKPAAFRTLRAVGAFLVSARFSGGHVTGVEILSEAGSALRVLIPWDEGARVVTASGTSETTDRLLELPTAPGETILLLPLSTP